MLRQRRMGVEPTRSRAERPPSRFEDGETHRGPYTSMGYSCIDLVCCQANTLIGLATIQSSASYITWLVLAYLIVIYNYRLSKRDN